MTTDEIAEVISVGLDPNGETGKFILKRLCELEAENQRLKAQIKAADELSNYIESAPSPASPIGFQGKELSDKYRDARKEEP